MGDKTEEHDFRYDANGKLIPGLIICTACQRVCIRALADTVDRCAACSPHTTSDNIQERAKKIADV